MNEKMITELLGNIKEMLAAGNQEGVNRALGIIEKLTTTAVPTNEQIPQPGKYLYARVMTTSSGEKHYHPWVGGTYPSSNPDDYKMSAFDNILDLQNDSSNQTMLSMARTAGYNMQIVYVPNDAYAELEQKLVEHVSGVFDALGEAVPAIQKAAALMGIEMEADEILREETRKVMRTPAVAGVGITASNTIVEASEYQENQTSEKTEDEYDEEEDDLDEYGYDDCNEECDECYKDDCPYRDGAPDDYE